MSGPVSLEGQALKRELDNLKRTLIVAGVAITAAVVAAYVLGYRDGRRDG